MSRQFPRIGVTPVRRLSEFVLKALRRGVFGQPKLAVAAYMVERPGKHDSTGAEMTRDWLFQQWARIAKARSAVRLVVIEGSVRGLDPGWATYQQWINALQACRSAGQELYGYVPVSNGNRDAAEVAAEVAEWQTNVGAYIDGIYLDEGPTSCDPAIARNYRMYIGAIRSRGLKVFVLAPQWPDTAKDAAGQPDPWLRSLNPEYIQLWEEGVVPYRNQYGGIDFCAENDPLIDRPRWWIALASWGLPGQPWKLQHAVRRVHAINDCADAATMRSLVPLALGRLAYTVWITKARIDPQLGSVYDELPIYWDDMVAFIGTL